MGPGPGWACGGPAQPGLWQALAQVGGREVEEDEV